MLLKRHSLEGASAPRPAVRACPTIHAPEGRGGRRARTRRSRRASRSPGRLAPTMSFFQRVEVASSDGSVHQPSRRAERGTPDHHLHPAMHVAPARDEERTRSRRSRRPSRVFAAPSRPSRGSLLRKKRILAETPRAAEWRRERLEPGVAFQLHDPPICRVFQKHDPLGRPDLGYCFDRTRPPGF
jgi:hypothetical protein